MMRRIVSLARPAAMLLCAAFGALTACYEYRPVAAPTPPVGERVALEITDQGRVTLSSRFGPGLSEVQGRLVSAQNDEYVLNVFRVSQLSGESAAWSGEATRIDRAFVGRVKGRRLSTTRTAIASIAGAVAMYFVITRGLSGLYTGDRDEPEPPTPLSNRIPLGVRF